MIKTVKRILLMAGDHCHKVTAGIGISLLYSIFSAMDLFAILYIAFSVDELTMQKNSGYCRHFACWSYRKNRLQVSDFKTYFRLKLRCVL